MKTCSCFHWKHSSCSSGYPTETAVTATGHKEASLHVHQSIIYLTPGVHENLKVFITFGQKCWKLYHVLVLLVNSIVWPLCTKDVQCMWNPCGIMWRKPGRGKNREQGWWTASGGLTKAWAHKSLKWYRWWISGCLGCLGWLLYTFGFVFGGMNRGLCGSDDRLLQAEPWLAGRLGAGGRETSAHS